MSDRKSPVEQWLDLFVYAPLGFALNLEEVLPQLIEKGHQQVNMARMFGQFAVKAGTDEARKRVEQFAERGPKLGARPASPARPSPVVEVVDEPASPVVEAAEVVEVVEQPSNVADLVPAADALPIPGYDSLSASQVVPRLDGLSADERSAVQRYEAAHRGRKTILSKLAQLGAA